MMPSLNAVIGRLGLRRLSLLIALDEHRSLHRPPRATNLNQPAATKDFNEIEVSIGAALFERSWQGRAGQGTNQIVGPVSGLWTYTDPETGAPQGRILSNDT